MQEFLEQEPHKFLLDGEKKKYWKIDKDKKKIQYFLKTDKSYKITDPEEIVRAEFFMELLEKYQYEAKDIEFEREMPQRVPNFYADIVVNRKGTDTPFLVIECKRVDITDAEFEQSVKQGAGNSRVLASEYFGAVAGESRRFFLTKNFSEKNPLEKAESDCPVKYNKPEEWRFKKGDDLWDLQTIDQEGLKSILDKCHQTIWQGGKRNPGEAFSEVAKVIFVKVFDERELTTKGEYYQFQRKSGESSANVKKRIDKIYTQAKTIDPEVFSEDIRLDAQEITTVVEHLQKISLHKTDLDVKGEAFQKFMGNFFKGDFGQYFTPPPTVQFCLDLFKEDLTNLSMVIDPACGSGGFLLKTLDSIRDKANKKYPDYETDVEESRDHFNNWHGFAEKKLFGCEISESIARVAKMNMILHDDGHTNVIAHDTLALDVLDEVKSINEETGDEFYQKNTTPNFQKGFKHDNFDFIFTNPPFGATIRGSEKPYLENYELAYKKKNQKTEILFIERCWQFLKEGGKMAIVLPDGILTNSSLQYVRDWILDHFKLLGVVSLPQDAFRYYGAGVKSSILILEKGKFSEDYPIFMAQPEKIGVDSTGRECENDLDEVVKQFWEFQKDPKGFQKKKPKNLENIFVVWRKEIKENLSANFYFGNANFDKSFKSLFEIAEINPKTNRPIQKDAKFPYVGLPDCSLREIKNIDWRKDKYGSKICQKNDILFARIEPSVFNRKFIFADNIDESVFVSGEFYVIRANPEICNQKYLYYQLFTDSIFNQFSGKTTGSTGRRRLDITSFKNLKIPLPPLEIQKQIAEKMDKAFEVKKEKEQEAKEILASIEPYLLGELGIEEVEEEEKEMIFIMTRKEIENGSFLQSRSSQIKSKFKIYSFGDIFESLNNGLDNRDYQKKGDFKYITVANVKNGEISDKSIKFINSDLSKGILKKEDVIITRKGTVGSSAVSKTNNEYVISSEIFQINLSKNIIPEYFSYINNSKIIQKQYVEKSTGAIMPSIAQENLKSIKLPIPPIEIQKSIVLEVSTRREKAKQLRKEAGEVLAGAKKEVENIILGE